ncbi:nucleoside deaminase [Achromobacter sp. UMC71]|uniref:nucleoside deaminase n=1 Tax=Achromobacter sp. UMC71 TaxID=1862320 RepID=UPI00160341AA|nr:nucleoside deaminase [Achromobacter sp. UMC71]MBB1627689.1 tRNA-specific adenosine deaminase [Achromobacter sp. UMC71]
MITQQDKHYLARCVELARQALAQGDEPFGSILVSSGGQVLFEDCNHVAGGDHTRHPEFEIARWAAANLAPADRAASTVYTSGEHCAMCAAAHGWVGLGRIVYASSTPQLSQWMQELGLPAPRVKALRITDVITDTPVDGPDEELAQQVRALHQARVKPSA